MGGIHKYITPTQDKHKKLAQSARARVSVGRKRDAQGEG